MYLFVYTFEEAKLFNLTILIIGIFYLIQNRSKIIISFISLIITLIFSLSLSLIVAFIIDFIFKNPMSWYSYGSKFSIILYALPTLFGMILSLDKLKIHNPNSILLFWLILLCLGTFYQISASYIALYFSISFMLLSISFVLFYIFSLVPLILLLDISFITIETFSAILGRSGSSYSEYIISGIVSSLSFLIFTLLIPYIYTIPSQSKKLVLKVILFFIMISIIFSLTLFPYSESRPKRLSIQQVFSFNETQSIGSYITFTPLDGISETIIPNIKNLADKQVKRVYQIPTCGPKFKPEGYNVVSISTNDTIEILPNIQIKKMENKTEIEYKATEKIFAVQFDIITTCEIQKYSFDFLLEKDQYLNETHYKFTFYNGYQNLKSYQFWFEHEKCDEIKVEVNTIILESQFISESLKKTKKLIPTWVSDYTITIINFKFN